MRTLIAFLAAAFLSAPAFAVDNVGVVSHVKVLSDKVQDVSSLEAWKAAFIKPEMSDQDKALAIWKSVVMFRHQDVPPNEFLETETHPHDPIEDFNVYGYGQCCCASANVEALARYIGMDARGWGITGHSVPEISIGGHWCMFDASLINYFKKPDGSIAGVEEAGQSITSWIEKHPEFKDNEEKLRQFMPRDGWKNGPEIIAGGTGYDDNGWLPAATHGWYSTLSEFGDLRLCADYREPHGGFAPVRVTYAWDEAGTPHHDVHVVHQPDETYTLHCDSKPVMKSIALQLAQ